MRHSRWAAAVVGVAIAIAVPGAAAAQPSTPVTITLSPEQVQRICEKRIPRIETRVDRALTRIGAGPEVRGSTAWLKARAEKERAAGRETSAQLLDERADRRADRVPQLEQLKTKVAEFRTAHCGSK
ncbi:hypothetical protein ACFQV2_36975 [Actinokineospora soli]|uniref:Uncharacterized protein n=1 Tax=Actinokineospora soli TaxID=1048753 RepID=A0ABW2TW89_9PSEU